MERESGRPRRHYNVAICAQRLQFERVTNDRLHWTDTWEAADFFISPTHMACDAMLEGRVIATVERLGVVIGVVKDRRIPCRPGSGGQGAGKSPDALDPLQFS